MEVLLRYGTEPQKEQWLTPLLNGEIRSCFWMTEPGVASSDATNIEASIVRDGDHYILNGRKWWSSGAGDPRCKISIFMGKTDPTAARHKQQSMILVPLDTPGVKRAHASVFGYDDLPHGQRVSPQALGQAISMLQRAIELDPDYAAASAYLGHYLMQMLGYGVVGVARGRPARRSRRPSAP